MAIQQLHTYCAMCVSRCGVMATVEDGIFTQVHADPKHPNGCLCVKGSAAEGVLPFPPDVPPSPGSGKSMVRSTNAPPTMRRATVAAAAIQIHRG